MEYNAKGVQVTGFTDVAPVVREQTVKAVLTIVPKLSDRIVNGELLRYLAKTANDEQPGIRTNTTICLGKIARYLGANVRTFYMVNSTVSAYDDLESGQGSDCCLCKITSRPLCSRQECSSLSSSCHFRLVQ
jgi:SCY1-like protein 1